MTQEEAKKHIKDQLADYLYRQHGIDVSQSKKNFHCLAGTHEDNNPSMSYDRSRNKVHCFSCEADLDTLDLIQIDQKTDFVGALEYGKRLYNITTENYSKNDSSERSVSPPPSTSNNIRPLEEERRTNEYREVYEGYYRLNYLRLEQTDYHTKRGLSLETCERFNIGYDPNYKDATGGQVWEALIIPTTEKTYIARNTDPNAEARNRYRKHGESHIFNLEAIEQDNKAVFIVEGEIDALSIIEAGGEAIALGSTSNKDKLLRLIETGVISPKSLLILMLDNDPAGIKAQEELKAGLEELRITAVSGNMLEGYKDPNDILVKDKKALEAFIDIFPKTLSEYEETLAGIEREEYLSTSAFNDLNNFIIKTREKNSFYPTNYPYLDHILDGGLYAGLYFIGAISSLGKTTLALQIADQLAEQGTDVLIFSLEMDKNELIAKSVSRYTFLLDEDPEKKTAKTTRGILTGSRYDSYSDKETELIRQAIAEYAKIAGNIFISIGVGNIGAEEIKGIVEKHVRVTGKTPVVIIDYLQILAPYSDRSTDKQNTDKAVLELKRISRDFNTPIIGISSFNRDNYNEPVNLASFKESGAIEYSSDVLIGLQYAGMDYQEGETEGKRRTRVRELYKDVQRKGKEGYPLPIELKVLKNRNGSKGRTNFNFYPFFNMFNNVEDFSHQLIKREDYEPLGITQLFPELKELKPNKETE